MKDITPALRTYLLADSTISDLVGGGRIFYAVMDQQASQLGQTSLVFTKVSEIGDYHMQGDSGLGQMRVQFDAWAKRADEARVLLNEVHDRLSGQSGPLDNGSGSFVNVRGQFLAAGFDQYDPLSKWYRASRDYIIWYGASE